MPVFAASEKCINCPELEIDVFTKEKLNMKLVSDAKTKSVIIGYENLLKCKNWDEDNGTCPVICRCQAILKSVGDCLVDAVEKSVKEPASKKTTKTTTRKTTAKKAATKK